jgi:hypothetical protein
MFFSPILRMFCFGTPGLLRYRVYILGLYIIWTIFLYYTTAETLEKPDFIEPSLLSFKHSRID